MLNTLIHADMFDILPTIPTQSIDMILTDLPYNKTKASWDRSIINLDELWKEYKRVIKPHGAIVLTAMQPFTTTLISSNPKYFRYCWVWDKKQVKGHLNAKHQPMRQHEDIVIFSQDKPVYYPVTVPKTKYRYKSAKPAPSVLYGKERSTERSTIIYTFNYPTSILSIPQDRKDHIHPTQKPVALFEYLIRTYTTESQVVLDTCAGSGTTAIAAIQTNRQWICIEKDIDYVTPAQARIDRIYHDYVQQSFK